MKSRSSGRSGGAGEKADKFMAGTFAREPEASRRSAPPTGSWATIASMRMMTAATIHEILFLRMEPTSGTPENCRNGNLLYVRRLPKFAAWRHVHIDDKAKFGASAILWVAGTKEGGKSKPFWVTYNQ